MRMRQTEYTANERIRLGINVGIVTEVDGPRTTIFWIMPNGVQEEFTTELYGDKAEVGDVVDFRRYNNSPTCLVVETRGLTPPEYIPYATWAKLDTSVLQALREKNPTVYERLQSLAEQQLE